MILFIGDLPFILAEDQKTPVVTVCKVSDEKLFDTLSSFTRSGCSVENYYTILRHFGMTLSSAEFYERWFSLFGSYYENGEERWTALKQKQLEENFSFFKSLVQ